MVTQTREDHYRHPRPLHRSNQRQNIATSHVTRYEQIHSKFNQEIRGYGPLGVVGEARRGEPDYPRMAGVGHVISRKSSIASYTTGQYRD